MLNRILPIIISFCLFFILLFLYTKLAGPIPFSVNSVTTNKSDSFEVSGEGSVSVPPDQATTENPTQIEPGSSEIKMTVTLNYEVQ